VDGVRSNRWFAPLATAGTVLVLVALIGARIVLVVSSGGMAFLAVMPLLALLAVIGGALVVVLVIGGLRRSRSVTSSAAAGIVAFGLALVLVVGFAPRHRSPAESQGHLRVALDVPADPVWTGAATCRTHANSESIETVGAAGIDSLGARPVEVRVSLPRSGVAVEVIAPRDRSVQPPTDSTVYRGDPAPATALGPQGVTGSATFAVELEQGPPLDVDGARTTLRGTVDWSCAPGPPSWAP
jgi:hypothetical protein